MPQVTLHHGNFEVQMQISSEAPTDVFGLADQLVEFARVLVGKVTEARLADRLREELGPCARSLVLVGRRATASKRTAGQSARDADPRRPTAKAPARGP